MWASQDGICSNNQAEQAAGVVLGPPAMNSSFPHHGAGVVQALMTLDGT